jgi:hypothetical protein
MWWRILACCWNSRILETPVVGFLPLVKQHHVILLSPRWPGLPSYALDFTHRDSSLLTKLKLLLGMTVPAKIRLRRGGLEEEEEREWVMSEWSEMNLYTRNCQHFSHRALRRPHAG